MAPSRRARLDGPQIGEELQANHKRHAPTRRNSQPLAHWCDKLFLNVHTSSITSSPPTRRLSYVHCNIHHPQVGARHRSLDQAQRRAFVMALATLLPTKGLLASNLNVTGRSQEFTATIGRQELLLNGEGIRFRGPFAVYGAALFLTEKLSTPEAIYANKGAKRLQITMMRSINSSDLGRLFIAGIQKNSPRELLDSVLPSLPQMGAMFANYKTLVEGEQIQIDWRPGTGTQIRVKGEEQSTVFASPAFYEAMLRIWLGNAPADDNLKSALLGSRILSAPVTRERR